MVKTYFSNIGWFVGLILLQALILNNVHIGGYATPFLYIYFVLKLDSGISRNQLLLWGFLIGITVDLFSNTPGMNAAATVFLAFIRPVLLNLFIPRDNQDNITPSFKSMGRAPFIKYLIVGVLVHHLILLTIEFFSLASLAELYIRILASALLTIALIIAMEGIRKK